MQSMPNPSSSSTAVPIPGTATVKPASNNNGDISTNDASSSSSLTTLTPNPVLSSSPASQVSLATLATSNSMLPSLHGPRNIPFMRTLSRSSTHGAMDKDDDNTFPHERSPHPMGDLRVRRRSDLLLADGSDRDREIQSAGSILSSLHGVRSDTASSTSSTLSSTSMIMSRGGTGTNGGSGSGGISRLARRDQSLSISTQHADLTANGATSTTSETLTPHAASNAMYGARRGSTAMHAAVGPRGIHSPGLIPVEPVSFNRVLISYCAHVVSEETAATASRIHDMLSLRQSFVFAHKKRDTTLYDVKVSPPFVPPSADIPAASAYHFHFAPCGVYTVHVASQQEQQASTDSSSSASSLFSYPDRTTFVNALMSLIDLVMDAPARSFCHNRLHLLEIRFGLHQSLNGELEQLAQKAVPHRDFYNVRKIDNQVHHSACMNQKHLLRFIKAQLRKQPDTVVIVRNDKPLTLAQVFESLGLTPYDLSTDTLDMHADNSFHRFDKFNLKYNPVGESRLREIFLKYNNHIKGKFLAEITREVFDDLESNKYQFAEYRVSIYGTARNEWDTLAEWIVDNQLFHYNVRWMIQIPRLYSVYKSAGKLHTFGELIENVFHALFEVTVDPSTHPKLHQFLQQCVGFDIVDDESQRERAFHDGLPAPAEWNVEFDPPYAYYAYYVSANLRVLNQLREARGFSTFDFRPHAGEAGDVEHLAACFLLARSINHGIVLHKHPVMQYLYYLAQVGISMSPLCNNLLFVEYDQNPFPKFFKRGLNVTLSTDDPLMIHVTKEPLVEEYSVAAQVWKLTSVDMSEIARNSVLQSGFEHQFKVHFLGNRYWQRGLSGNDIRQTNVPAIRVQFRAELHAEELALLSSQSGKTFDGELVDPL